MWIPQRVIKLCCDDLKYPFSSAVDAVAANHLMDVRWPLARGARER